MKKTTIIGLVVLLALAMGQNLGADEGAIKVGVNFGSVTNSGEPTIFGNPQESRFLTGLSVGVLYRFSLLEWLSIQPELLYVENGYQQKVPGTIGTTTQKIKLNYLEIPLVFRIQLNKTLYITVGPYIGFRLAAKLQTKEDTLASEKFDLDAAEKRDKGWIGGVGLILDDDASAFVEIRYKLGSSGILDMPGFPVQKNSCLSICLGYGF